MGVKGILISLFRGSSGKDGIWDFLGKRAEGMARVDLEDVRNQGTREAIQLLMPGMVLRESGPDWSREISMPDAPACSALFTAASRPSAIVPLSPAELEPPRQCQGPAGESLQ
jgi:hypothetical protein